MAKAAHFLVFDKIPDVPRPSYEPSARIAVIGGGPSGVMAAWLLRQQVGHTPRRVVHLYEAGPTLGGHAESVKVDDVTLDMGFIFSTPKYHWYHTFLNKFGYKAAPSVISVTYHGDMERGFLPYSNLDGGAGDLFRTAAMRDPGRIEKLEADIKRFKAKAESIEVLDMLCPLWLWIRIHGYGQDFAQSVLYPILSTLYVSGKGQPYQSAGSALMAVRPSSGFFPTNASDKQNSPILYHTVGGVKHLYESMAKDAGLNAKDGSLRLSTPVSGLRQFGDGRWRVDVDDHRQGEVYDKVVIACDAQTAAKLLRHGGYSHWRVLAALDELDYEEVEVLLTRTGPLEETRSGGLYHIGRDGLLAGSIDRILETGPGNFRLQGVHARAQASRPILGEVIHRRHWKHLTWTLYQLFIAKKIIPRFNYRNNLVFAGAWVYGMGQEDALRSAALAACAVGLTDEVLQQVRLVTGDTDYCVGDVSL